MLFDQMRQKPFFILGPCVMENQDLLYTVAEKVAEIGHKYHVPVIFKSSFDKANRTSIHSYRGPGIEKGMEMLQNVKDKFHLPVLTDIHESCQGAIAAEVCDVLQIPAFLCRQTDLLVAAAKTGRIVNIKKGQFLAPDDVRHAVAKVTESGNSRVFLTERGTTFGYNNLVVDMRSLAIMRSLAPVVFDGTHSVQTPSAANGVSGGQPEFIPLLTRAAVAAGVDGVFLEVHDNPAEAKSDGANALDLKNLRGVLESLLG